MDIKINQERRFFVKIRFNANADPSSGEVVYFKNDMTFNFFIRWQWYFKYREALIRVNYPRAFIELTHGSYEHTIPDDEYKKRVKNLLTAAKRKRTEFTKKLAYARKHWDELFPIEQHPYWAKIEEKRKFYEKRIVDLTNEYRAINL